MLEKKTFTTIIVFFFVAVGIVGAIIVPTVRYILDLDRQANELRILLEKKNERAIHFRATLKQIDRIKAEAPDFSVYFFSLGDELKLVTTLENLANRTAVNQHINSTNIDSITNQRVLFTLTVYGEYEKVLNYLSELERLPYFLNITKLNLVPSADRTNKNTQVTNPVALTIDLVLYVSKQ